MAQETSTHSSLQQLPVTFTDTNGHEETYLLIGEVEYKQNYYLIFSSLKETTKSKSIIILKRFGTKPDHTDYLLISDKEEMANIFQAFNAKYKNQLLKK